MSRNRVLLVHDDEAVRATMGKTLAGKGFHVRATANPSEALRLIATESFDGLILNLNMSDPRLGFGVITSMLRSQPDP